MLLCLFLTFLPNILSIYFLVFLKLYLTQRHGGNGGFMQGCVAHEGVLMLNR